MSVVKQQFADSPDRLAPKARREAVLRFLAGVSTFDRTVEGLQPRLIAMAKERGLDWAGLCDEVRERLVDEILHE